MVLGAEKLTSSSMSYPCTQEARFISLIPDPVLPGIRYFVGLLLFKHDKQMVLVEWHYVYFLEYVEDC